jgi:hypothetical protein
MGNRNIQNIFLIFTILNSLFNFIKVLRYFEEKNGQYKPENIKARLRDCPPHYIIFPSICDVIATVFDSIALIYVNY